MFPRILLFFNVIFCVLLPDDAAWNLTEPILEFSTITELFRLVFLNVKLFIVELDIVIIPIGSKLLNVLLYAIVLLFKYVFPSTLLLTTVLLDDGLKCVPFNKTLPLYILSKVGIPEPSPSPAPLPHCIVIPIPSL